MKLGFLIRDIIVVALVYLLYAVCMAATYLACVYGCGSN